MAIFFGGGNINPFILPLGTTLDVTWALESREAGGSTFAEPPEALCSYVSSSVAGFVTTCGANQSIIVTAHVIRS